MKKLHYDGPIVLVVMDGIGLSPRRSGNAVRQAHTEFLDYALSKYLNIPLAASGEAVGILPGQMGNSEVGHNALGSGQIIKQGIAGIEAAFQTGDIWQSKAWKGAISWLGAHGGLVNPAHAKQATNWDEVAAKANTTPTTATLHFAGIFSDGGVHSDIKHLEQMIAQAYQEGVRRIRIHCAFDGRDVAPQSEPKYIERLEKFCHQFKDADFRIASGAGRMVAICDRYENDWGMVKLGWDMIVHGQAPREFTSATEAIKTFRRENPNLQDQYIPAFVIIENAAARSALASRAIKARSSRANSQQGAAPIGRVHDGDAFIYYDFRADRAVEIATAFTQADFNKFNRRRPGEKTKVVSARAPKTMVEGGKLNLDAKTGMKFAHDNAHSTTAKTRTASADANGLPDIYFAGLTEYDSDRHIPANVLVPPIKISQPLNTFLGRNKVSQLAISETVKFGHITYYFNGNSYKKAPREGQVEIISDTQPFNTRPWMKSAEITDAALEAMDRFQFVRLNYPGGDMVGHFAELEPTIVAVEAIDLQLARLAKKVDELGGMLLITADHGNAEELIDQQGIPKTSHTISPVPCIFYDNTKNAKLYHSANLKDAGLSNVAATIALLLGLPDYPASWRPPLIKV